MLGQDRIIKLIALKLSKSQKVVKYVADHPILFAKRKMASPDDSRSIRIKYLGVFTPKYSKNKYNIKRYKEFSALASTSDELLLKFREAGYNIEDKEEFNYIIHHCFNNNFKVFNKLYDLAFDTEKEG